MAMRRPPADVVVPCELARFDADEWPAPDDVPPDVTWYPAYQRWCDARREWVTANPGTPLGDWFDVTFDDRTFDSLLRFRPLEVAGPVSITEWQITEGVIDPITGSLRGRLKGEEHIPAGEVGTRYCDWQPGPRWPLQRSA
jgi:hypothetical protein